MIAINEVDVGKSWRSEQNGITCGSPSRCMRSRVTFAKIGLGLDDASGANCARRFAHQQFPQQSTRHLPRITVEESGEQGRVRGRHSCLIAEVRGQIAEVKTALQDDTLE